VSPLVITTYLPPLLSINTVLIPGGNNGGNDRKKGWANKDLDTMIESDDYTHTLMRTWTEQRSFVHNAVRALPSSSALRQTIEKEFEKIEVVTPFSTEGFEKAADPTKVFDCAGTKIGFSSKGGITTLTASGVDWADSAHPIAQFWYNNYDGPYFDAFVKNYSAGAAVNNNNFGKPGLTQTRITAMNADPSLKELWVKNAGSTDNKTSTQFVLRLSMPDPAHQDRGAPATLEVLVTVPAAATAPPSTSRAAPRIPIGVELHIYNKTACRLPETLWLTNRPAVNDRTAWTVSKLGQPVNPLDADLSNNSAMAALSGAATACVYPSYTCGAHLHAVDDGGATYTGTASAGGTGILQLQSVDNMLLSVGEPLAVPTPLAVPDPLGGVHFALIGNIW
jgi:hypothetical protein